MNRRKVQKNDTREQIVGSAARHLKMKGLSGASVSEIMGSAGLTVGGFYAHFPSKDALADEVVHRAMSERRQKFLERFEGRDWADRIGSALREYLTPAHRDDPANGCPLSMAAVEAMQNQATAPAFVEEIARFAEAFEIGKDPIGPPAPREAAIGTLALMIGGMLLARATRKTALSDEVLAAVDAYGQAALGNLAQTPDERPGRRQGGEH